MSFKVFKFLSTRSLFILLSCHITKADIPYSMSVELPPRFGGESAFIVSSREIRRIGEEVWSFHKEAAEMLIAEFTSS